jgi:hypothetical protein
MALVAHYDLELRPYQMDVKTTILNMIYMKTFTFHNPFKENEENNRVYTSSRMGKMNPNPLCR